MLELIEKLIKCYKPSSFQVESAVDLQTLISESCLSLAVSFRCERKDSAAHGAVQGKL